MKILVIALSGIGDALMFTPALNLLRKSYPDAQIDALVMFGGVKDIYERNSNINKVYHFNFLKEGALKSFFYLLKFFKIYDISINVYPSNRKEYNLFSFFIGAKKRAAVEYIRMNKKNLGFLNNLTIKENDLVHNVEHNVKLVKKITGNKFEEIPALEFSLLEEDLNFAEEYLKSISINESDLVIGFHPGCSTLKNHIRRRWEPEKFIELGKQLIQNKNAKIFIFGGPEENDLKKLISSGINSKNVFEIHTKNLAQSAAIMKRCNLFITNDSSLMHVSAAMQLNVLALIGPTNTNYIYPWKTNYKIAALNLECMPCFFYSPKPLICYRNDVLFKCIKELTVKKVYNIAEEFIK